MDRLRGFGEVSTSRCTRVADSAQCLPALLGLRGWDGKNERGCYEDTTAYPVHGYLLRGRPDGTTITDSSERGKSKDQPCPFAARVLPRPLACFDPDGSGKRPVFRKGSIAAGPSASPK